MQRDLAGSLLRPRLEREADVVTAWLFGSVARGTEHAGRDVDVAILFDGTPSPTRALDLESDLASALGCEAQVIDASSAPVDLLHRVFREGVLLVERDRSKRIRFEVDARNRYFDMTPILLEYRRARQGGE